MNTLKTKQSLLFLGALALLTLAPTLADDPARKRKAPVVTPPRVHLRGETPAGLAFKVWARRLPTTSAQQRKVKKIVVLSEGYRAGEEAAFLSDAQDLAERLLTESAGPAILSRWNVDLRYVFVPSAEAVSLSRRARTNFGAHKVGDVLDYTQEGELAIAETIAATVGGFRPDIKATLCKLAPGDDPSAVRAWCHLPWNGGRMSLVDGDRAAFVHELGHGLFGLGDEYGNDHARAPTEAEKVEQELHRHFNLIDDARSTAWRIHTAKPLREGGNGFARGVWHAFEYCRMNQSRSQRFCAVCEAHLEFVRDHERSPQRALPHIWMQILHEPTAATDATGTQVLIASHVVDNLPFGVVFAAANAPVRLRFNQYGHRPSKWKVTIEGHGVNVSKELKGSVTDVTFSSGFAALVDDPNVGVKKHYLIMLTNMDHDDVHWGGQKVDSFIIGRLRVE